MLAYDLDYTADAGCPERAAFVAWVDAQLREAHETTPGSRPRAWVRLQQVGPDVSARLELTREDGSSYARELGGESCDAAAEALAFVLAYALSGGDRGNAAVPAPPPAAATPSAPGEPAAPAAATSSAPVEPAKPAPSAPAAAVPAAAAEAPPSLPPRWRFGFAAQLGARAGLAPVWTPVESGLFDVRRRKSGLAPVLRVAVQHAEPVQRVDAFGSTEFSWLAARVEGCPLQLPLVETLQAVPCAGVHLGRIRAEGKPKDALSGAGRRVDEPWVDAVLALRLELTLVRLLQLELQADALVPFTPYQFAFDNPDTSVYQVPRLAWAGFAGLGLHFP